MFLFQLLDWLALIIVFPCCCPCMFLWSSLCGFLLLIVYSPSSWIIVCLENSHARSRGRCLSIEYTDKVGELSKKYGLKLQIDSAHIFNASVVLELPVHRLVQAADSVLQL
ncbi:low-specificity L-threonine aldolase 1 isoform X3 [Capsicum galapagoense]